MSIRRHRLVVRVKPSGASRSLQIGENRRAGRRTVPRVLATLGRVDQLAATGAVDGLRRSLGRFADQGRGIAAHRHGQREAGAVRPLGPALVFGRLWQAVGRQGRRRDRRRERHFECPVERAIYRTGLHRLCASGAERAADRWRRDGPLPDTDGLALHHLYRARRWLGARKGAVEEALFHQRRALGTDRTLAFCATTSLDFEGHGGESRGPYGHATAHRPALRHMVVGAVLTGEGRPSGGELWPGTAADGRALLPVGDRLRERVGIRPACWVAARGMISARTIQAWEPRRLEDILAARRRRQREVRQEGLGRAGRYHEVADTLRVKEVGVQGRRDIVCHHPEEAAKDAAEREAMRRALEEQLRQGAKRLLGTRGCRRCRRIAQGAVRIDPAQVTADARDDGKFVLRPNTTLPAAEVAVQSTRLLLVAPFFRAAKSLVEPRPIFPQWDASSGGHVFCSFLALVLVDELRRCLTARGWQLAWADIRRDLAALAEVEVRAGAHGFLLRTALQGTAGKVLHAVGVAIPPPVRPLPDVVPRPELRSVTY